MTDQEQVQDPQPTDGSNQAPDEMSMDFGDTPEQEETQTPSDEKEEPAEPEPKYINQEAVDKKINKVVYEKHEERRKREEIEQKFAKLQAELEKQRAAQQEVQIPDMPDLYDDDFEAKLKIREEALSKAAAVRARKEFLEEQRQKDLHAKAQAENAKISKQVDAMYKNAKDFGMTKDELDAADRTVSGFIQNQSLARFILAQKDSAGIVKYLASSPTEMEDIRQMDPMDASVYIATRIAPQAAKLKPGITQTPDPIDIPKKESSAGNDYLKGVTFE